MVEYINNCPICGKERHYRTKQGRDRASKNNKACKSCSNSLKGGGEGVIIINGLKKCFECKEFKPLEDYTRQNGRIISYCKTCTLEKSKNYHKTIHKFRQYGITKEKFEEILKNQDNLCAICNNPLVLPVIDHCHSSGKVRGILCDNCNKGLGQFKDDINRLERAIKYILNG